MKKLEISRIKSANGTTWLRCIEIYNASFPEWERESSTVIANRINSGQYLMYAGTVNDEVVGFYILDVNGQFDYVIFTFLAVEQQARGEGLGTTLCISAMRTFESECHENWLFIEAEDRQAKFYGGLGFKKLDLPYETPRFDGSGTVPMHLMVLARKEASIVPAHFLRASIKNIFINGYLLDADDPRIARQLSFVKDDVPVLTWPKE